MLFLLLGDVSQSFPDHLLYLFSLRLLLSCTCQLTLIKLKNTHISSLLEWANPMVHLLLQDVLRSSLTNVRCAFHCNVQLRNTDILFTV